MLDQHAKRLHLKFQPKFITSDFEKALIKSVAEEVKYILMLTLPFHLNILFPNARHIGCYFYYTQSIYKNIQRLGLSDIYRDEEDARLFARKLMALPLLPLAEVDVAFENIADECIDSMKPLLDYFQNFWMTKVPINLWNVSDLDTRTNNHVEGEIIIKFLRLIFSSIFD